MLDAVQPAPPDPILGLSAAFDQDPNPDKINLGVGEFRDADGGTPILESVREAEAHVVATETSKKYLPIDGTPEYGHHVRALLFGTTGEDHGPRCATVQAPGGTGALRVAADFVHRQFPAARVWLSDPTWANHPQIFAAADVDVASYAYYDSVTRRVDVERLIASLDEVQAGDVVLLHGCCHNPTGADLTTDDWTRVGEALASSGAMPLVDFAYQGFGDGLEEDAAGLRALSQTVPELFVASSFSKNFGLYRERVGALTAVTASSEAAARVLSQLKICVRTSFSNPPAHGSAIVTEILSDAGRRERWASEVAAMRDRINGMRQLLVDRLAAHDAPGDFSFIVRQRGMFSFSGLEATQVERLRDEHGVYVVGSGRINVAGITPANVDYLCAAIAAVLS
jgi:aspartate/tyrosine/aromatic aminotransferase